LFVGEHMAKDEPEGIGLETGRDERAGRLSTHATQPNLVPAVSACAIALAACRRRC